MIGKISTLDLNDAQNSKDEARQNTSPNFIIIGITSINSVA